MVDDNVNEVVNVNMSDVSLNVNIENNSILIKPHKIENNTHKRTIFIKKYGRT